VKSGQLPKELIWIGSSRKDMMSVPRAVQRIFGYGLYLAQLGDKSPEAKPLKGFHGASILEIIEDYRGDTYRAVYTVRFTTKVYVLHVFQKKAKRRIETPKHVIDLIKDRFKQAEIHFVSKHKDR
jgi:phage-related protein